MTKKVDKQVISEISYCLAGDLLDFFVQSRNAQEVVSGRYPNTQFYLAESSRGIKITSSGKKVDRAFYQLFLGKPTYSPGRAVLDIKSYGSIQLVRFYGKKKD